MIDAMTLGDVRELCEYWAEHPPVHTLVAAFVGFKAESDKAPGWREVLAAGPEADQAMPDWAVPQMLAGIPNIEAGRLPLGMEAPTFDADALMRMRPN